MPAILIALLLAVGAFFGCSSSGETAKNANELIQTSFSAPGLAAKSIQQARTLELQNDYVAKEVAAKAAVLESELGVGLIKGLMTADYEDQIQTKQLAAAKAKNDYEIAAVKSGIDLKILNADAENRIKLATEETGRSIWFGRVGGVCAIILIPIGVVWLSWIVLKFMDGMAKAGVRRANYGIETRELNSGPFFEILRVLGTLGAPFIPELPPRLLVFANPRYGAVTTLAITNAGDVTVVQEGPTGLQILGAETAAMLATTALKSKSEVARNMSLAFRDYYRGLMLSRALLALRGRSGSAEVAGAGVTDLVSVTHDPDYAEILRAASEAAIKLVN